MVTTTVVPIATTARTMATIGTMTGESWTGRRPRVGEFERGYREGYGTRGRVPHPIAELLFGMIAVTSEFCPLDSDEFRLNREAHSWLHTMM